LYLSFVYAAIEINFTMNKVDYYIASFAFTGADAKNAKKYLEECAQQFTVQHSAVNTSV